jgi:L-threonylcarbamoyladenylate synthase
MPLLDAQDPQSIERAAQALADGALVAFPTETVYGLGARADDDAAVARIFAAKGRPPDHPLIVHVVDAAAAQRFAADLPPVARRLMQAFWPGPLTVIVPRAAHIAAAAAGGQGTIGLRCPAHPLAHALLAAAAAHGVPGVAAPSANRFGRISATHAEHVRDEFGDALLVLDGGACALGIESSIVDCSRGGAVLLRPGSLTRAQIEAAAGVALGERDAAAPRASGTLAAHYAPRAKLRLMPAAMLRTALEVWREGGGNKAATTLAVYSRSVPAPRGIRHRQMPGDAAQVAHELFSVLRELDDEGVQLIWVEQPPDTPDWEGVRDRLQRAAAA